MQDPQGEEQRGPGQTLGWFALVAYIPDPLAGFLDALRLDLYPSCNPRAHVTVLPPRPHFANLKQTTARLSEIMGKFAPFTAEAGAIHIFEISSVVYLDLSAGAAEFKEIYRALNRGPLAFREDFEYHPHITLAQQVSREEAERLADVAWRRWDAYTGPRTFRISKFSFVQHVAPSIWTDVATIGMKDAPMRPSASADSPSEADASEPFPAHSEEAFQPR